MHTGMRNKPIARTSLLFISIALFIGVYSIPVAAQAQVATVSCGAPTISNFTPYVYNGNLESFDYYVEDTTGKSYLPLSTTINGQAVDLNYVSVWHNVGPNKIKVHVDVPDALVIGNQAIIGVGILQITQGPPPVCPTQAVFHVNLPGANNVPVSPGTTVGTTPIPTTPTIPPTTVITPTTPTTPTTTPATTTTPSPEEGRCRELPVWWIIALAVLDILVTAVLLISMSYIAKSNGRLTAAVLVPPALFIALWYFINTCLTNIWFPILAVILGIIVLIASGTPDSFETIRIRTMRFFGRRTETVQMKLSEATSIMEVR